MAITTLSPRRFQRPDLYRNCLLFATVLLACQVAGCKKENNPVGPSSGGGGGKIVVGTPIDLGSMTVPVSGGTLTITRPGSPVDGMQIKVPRNSYTDGRSIQVSYAPVLNHQLGTNITLLSPLITISNGGGYADSIMAVKIPVKLPAGYFAMGFAYDDATGELEGMPLLGHDSSSITIGTRHFSYSSVSTAGFAKALFRGTLDPAVRAKVVIASIRELDLNAAFDTGFRPGVDDWGFPNCGSYIAPNGHCYGQSVGAIWYYLEKKSKGSPALWRRFDNDGYSVKTPDIWEDDVLGYKFCSVVHSDRFPSLGDLVSFWSQMVPVLGDRQTYNLVTFSIYVSKKPQLFLLKSGSTGHAVIIYGAVGPQLFVCDPNYPGDLERRIIMNTLFFDPYYSGPDAAHLGVAYNHIFYAGIRALIDFYPIDSRWQEVQNKTIGNGHFPAYTILAENDTLKYEELKDGFTKTNGTFVLQVQGNGFDPLFRVYEPGGTVIAGEEPFHLSKGSHRIGVAVFNRDTNWVGFRWFTVNADSDTTRIYPLKLGNEWTYLYTSFREDGTVVSTEGRTYSVTGETVVSGEHWYQMVMTQGTTTKTVGFFTNRSDGIWCAVLPGSTGSFLLYKYPASVGDTYASGVNGSATARVLEIGVTMTVPGFGSYRHCHVYKVTRQGGMDWTDVTAAPGVGPLLSSDYEPKSAGGGVYRVREEALVGFTLK